MIEPNVSKNSKESKFYGFVNRSLPQLFDIDFMLRKIPIGIHLGLFDIALMYLVALSDATHASQPASVTESCA